MKGILQELLNHILLKETMIIIILGAGSLAIVSVVYDAIESRIKEIYSKGDKNEEL